jgi:hypothetical protein
LVGEEWRAYLLTSEVVLQQQGASLVIIPHRQPVIGVVLLNTKVACDAPLVVVDIFGDSGELGHLASLLANKALCLLCGVA